MIIGGKKSKLLSQIQIIDVDLEEPNANKDLNRKRLQIEELEKLTETEELYWQHRGGEKWVLGGDSNSSFFHLVANGRKRGIRW